MLPCAFLDLCHHHGKLTTLMFHGRRFDEHLAVEIAKHPFGARLGAVKADQTKMLRTDCLHTRMEDAVGLVQRETAASFSSRTTAGRTGSRHLALLLEKGKRIPFQIASW